jgi:hypothetical protein
MYYLVTGKGEKARSEASLNVLRSTEAHIGKTIKFIL